MCSYLSRCMREYFDSLINSVQNVVWTNPVDTELVVTGGTHICKNGNVGAERGGTQMCKYGNV